VPPAQKKPAAAPKKPKAEPQKSRTRERAEAARKAVQKSKGEGGPVVAGASYFRTRHQQEKARRGRQKEATERARVRGEQQRQQARAERRAAPLSRKIASLPRKALLAELVVCLVVVWGGALVAPKGSNNGATRAVVKSSGLAAVFLVLALVGSAGKGAQKAAAAFGALVTIAYVVASEDAVALATWAAGFFSREGSGSSTIGGDVGGGLGGTLGGGVLAGAGITPQRDVRSMQT
jgi:hypothetical protein